MEYTHFTIKLPKPSRRWLRFGLRSLLYVVLLIAVFLGALKIGWRQGYESARIDLMEDHLMTRTYYVAELVFPTVNGKLSTNADFKPLIAQLMAEVDPRSWDANGGHAEIRPFPTNLSVVISQTPENHYAIENYLKELGAAETMRIIEARTWLK